MVLPRRWRLALSALALAEGCSRSCEDVLSRADHAMYRVKRARRTAPAIAGVP